MRDVLRECSQYLTFIGPCIIVYFYSNTN